MSWEKCIFAAVALSVCVTIAIPTSAMAQAVTFTPAIVRCPCGAIETVRVDINGVVQDFGPPGGGQYYLRLVEADPLDDDRLIGILGTYPAFVPWGTPVAFKVLFELFCMPNCLELWPVRVVWLDLSVAGVPFVRQTQWTGPGDTQLLQNTPPGQYDADIYLGDTDEKIWEARPVFELSMEFPLDGLWNHGLCEWHCVKDVPVFPNWYAGAGAVAAAGGLGYLLWRRRSAREQA